MMRILLLCLLFVSCRPGLLFLNSTQPFYLLEIKPHAYQFLDTLPTDFHFSSTLSLPAKNAAIILKADDLNESVMQAMLSGKASLLPKNKRVSMQLWLLPDKSGIRMLAAERMQPHTRYAIVFSGLIQSTDGERLRDPQNSDLPLIVYMHTAHPPQQLLAHDVFVEKRDVVLSTRKTFHFQFAAPLLEEQLAHIALESATHGIVSPSYTLELSEDAKIATFHVPDLLAGSNYRFVLLGQKIEWTSAEPSEKEIDSALHLNVVAAEEEAQLQVRSQLPGMLRFWYGEDALSHLIINPTNILLRNLKKDTHYHYRWLFEDVLGGIRRGKGSFQTEDLPDIVISEVMSFPLKWQGQPDSEGEYIELYNASDGEHSLQGLSLQIDGKRPCFLLGEGEEVKIAAKSYVVLAGQRFLESYYPGLMPSLMLKMSGNGVCGLLHDDASTILLKDSAGRILSTFSAPDFDIVRGQSVVRIHEADGSSHYCVSDLFYGPSPGASNRCDVGK
jgi:hypothetical protein